MYGLSFLAFSPSWSHCRRQMVWWVSVTQPFSRCDPSLYFCFEPPAIAVQIWMSAR
ncbi:hypothetical protein SCLCIDRAFT_1206936 [Scleroderma citrinum Foug A]|uniref:Uncharacterized protein n=1 Tax=Scleroderma citrinum Foug A TaxID=1036808 RepID=A0A0C3ERM1_9AGAM|nr:hypothetical protein SCLCIDRAFT_1206936 [Scleroderma citrinum Foug A]